MQELKDILYGVKLISVKGNTNVKVKHLTFDSRDVNSYSVFIAIEGTVLDGHDFIPEVIEAGCSVIICSKKIPSIEGVNIITVDDTNNALALMASNFYGEPSNELKLIGITGTNGKTTIATLLHNAYSKLGYQAGLISTVINKICNQEIKSTHTTPNPIQLNYLLRQMVEEGCSHCFMEVSSHAIHQQRIVGLSFAGAAFTNITHDHLDYHKTFKEYINVKKSFFDLLPKSAFALTNLDDKNGEVMLQNTKARKKTYSLRTMADYKAKVLENQFSGLVLNINGKEIWTKLIGDFNAYNLLAVFAICLELGEDETEILTVISELNSVEGRFQYVISKDGLTAIVDYAHTPDALENALKTIENIRTRNESVISVLGCGGNRDKSKRPIMAGIACSYSDKVILTSDNPRNEDPDTIIEEMMKGVNAVHFKKTLSIVDRFQAIKTAVALAEKNDIILVAGKGHEKYQEIDGTRHPFDDMATLKELFTKLDK